MGRNQHSKDRLFITATEWREDYGGKKTGKSSGVPRPLAFDCCALSLAPFETPVCTAEGVVFDILNIMPYVKEHRKNPVNGAPLTTKDLVRLNYAKNADGKWHCPVTFKVFNDNSRIVAIRPTGNVFAAEAVEELNFKAKSLVDLLTGEVFEKKDVIKLNDPSNAELMAMRDINNFQHLKEVREGKASELAERAKAAPTSNIRRTLATDLIFKEIGEKRRRDAEEKEKQEERERAEAEAKDEASIAAGERMWKRRKVLTQDLSEGRVMTTGKGSGSFTSTSLTVSTENLAREATAAEIDEARWARARKLGKKGYCQLQTSKGNINVEVHCDIVPKTAENFLGLCLKGYYDGTKFHRSIRNFMVQGGDPTGTGKGGQSLWGGKFKDEFDSRMVHDQRGVLSMANSGPDTNGSQFFVTYKSCRHLDNVHAVFGRVVGGMGTLSAIEAVPTDKKERPKEEMVLVKAVVFSNPMDEADALLEKELEAKIEEREREAAQKAVSKAGATQAAKPTQAAIMLSGAGLAKAGGSSGVGKYLKARAAASAASLPAPSPAEGSSSSSAAAASVAVEATGSSKAKGRPAGGGFGNFSGW